MFTGLVEEVGVVRRMERRGEGGRLSVQAQVVLEGAKLGDSIAVSGACLTVVDLRQGGFTVDCMPETLRQTTLGSAAGGDRVNLERSLAVGGRMGGHLVLGHVDAVAEVLAVERAGAAWGVRFSLPAEIRACIAPKGSVAIDGISLTVIGVDEDGFEVGIIPHTLKETTLGWVQAGLRVNVEADVLARYVQRALDVRREDGEHRTKAPSGLTEELLREQGFV
ncbi:MAG: riboflavin synthase subunit alpha [Actinobacteria bacterium RBG_16_64_13]|nr:MAG: riboflavin synthase subunit alpha [Actinobacteria bacterium RBG_16_64_13]